MLQHPGASSAEQDAAFRQFFTVSIPEMQQLLYRYVSNGKYGWYSVPVPEVPAKSSYEKRAVPVDEINLRLAELAIGSQSFEAGLACLTGAGTRERHDARIQESLALLALVRNEPEVAREKLDLALTFGSTNPAINRYAVKLTLDSWLYPFYPHNEIAPVLLERLREQVLASLAQEPRQTTGYESLAWLEAFAAKPRTDNVRLVQKNFSNLIQKGEVVLAFALISWRTNKMDRARELLDQLATMDPDSNTQYRAEILRARMENRRPDFSGIRRSRREKPLQLDLP
jgi:hypothetical protein